MASTDPSKESDSDAEDEKLRRFTSKVTVCLIVPFSLAVFGWIFCQGYGNQAWLPIAKAHFAAVIGLPMAAVASLFIVLVLRMSTGPIEAEIGALKFKGAAAPIVFWLLCFLAIAGAVKMLWSSADPVFPPTCPTTLPAATK